MLLNRPVRRLRLLAPGALLLAGATGAEAQVFPRLGVGYVVNAPHQFMGFSAHAVSGRFGGIGLYVDAKFDLDSPSEEAHFIPELTVRQVEDEIGDAFFQEEFSWESFNAALVRPVTPELMLYLGAGYSRREVFREYVDQTGERGLLGHYWVADPDREGGTLNVLGGGLFRIGRSISLQFGAESTPRGATVGATYAIPLR